MPTIQGLTGTEEVSQETYDAITKWWDDHEAHKRALGGENGSCLTLYPYPKWDDHGKLLPPSEADRPGEFSWSGPPKELR